MIALLQLLACTVEPPDPPVGKRFEGMTVTALTAEITAPRRRPRIYNFWATWCQPCIAELPMLRDYARAHDDVELILVNVDLPSLRPGKVEGTVRQLDLKGFRNLAIDDDDPAFALMALEGWPQSVPVTLVVSAAGARVHQFNTRVDGAMLDRALAKAE